MRLSDIIRQLQALQAEHGERLVTSLRMDHGILDVEHEPLPTIGDTDWNTPIGGRGVIPGPPLAYLGMDQPLKSGASRESLPEAVARMVEWEPDDRTTIDGAELVQQIQGFVDGGCEHLRAPVPSGELARCPDCHALVYRRSDRVFNASTTVDDSKPRLTVTVKDE